MSYIIFLLEMNKVFNLKNHIISYLVFVLTNLSLVKVKVETRIDHGDPRDVICEMTPNLGADMLVMGSHGYGLIKRWVLRKKGNYRLSYVIIVILF